MADTWATTMIKTDLRACNNHLWGIIHSTDPAFLKNKTTSHRANDYYLQVWAFVPDSNHVPQPENLTDAISEVLGHKTMFYCAEGFQYGASGLLLPVPDEETVKYAGYPSDYAYARQEALDTICKNLSHKMTGSEGNIILTILS